MTTFLLVPGAGGAASYWDRVVGPLRAAGHEAVAVDLPGPDPHAGLPEYAERTVAAGRGRGDVVLVAQSLGGFAAALAAQRLPVSRLVFVNAMIPIPDETPGEWWAATGAVTAREQAAVRGGYGAFDVATYFLHDVDVTGLRDEQREESDAVFATPCTFTNSCRTAASAGWGR